MLNTLPHADGANLHPREGRPRSSAPGPGQATTSLVVGFDRDDASRAALAFAIDLGGRLQAQIHVVHVINLCDYPVDPDSPDWEKGGRETLAEERAYVEHTLGAYVQGWTYRAGRGDPASALAAAAQDHNALLLVVGRHHGGLTDALHRLTAGSVSRRLPGRSGRPVVVVPVT